jgi:hypothetical protein
VVHRWRQMSVDCRTRATCCFAHRRTRSLASQRFEQNWFVVLSYWWDGSVLKTAEADASRFGLEFPDAVMVAAVYLDAAKHNTPSMFLNRNTKDSGYRSSPVSG